MPEDPYTYVVAAFQALPPPDYVPGPKEPEQAPPSPVYIPYVLEPVYPEYIALEDDVFLAEEQPLPAAASPTAESPGYIPEFDPDEDPEEDDDEDPEEDAERFLAMPIPLPSPLTLLSSPLPQIPYSPLPASPLSSPYHYLLHHHPYSYYLLTIEQIDPRVMEDTQGRQTEIFQRVEALVDDNQYHYETGQLVDQEAKCSREAWAHSIGLSSAVHFELQGQWCAGLSWGRWGEVVGLMGEWWRVAGVRESGVEVFGGIPGWRNSIFERGREKGIKAMVILLNPSSNVTPTPVLDEIITLSGKTEIPKVMKIFFEQQIVEDEAFTKYIRDKIADVKASLTRVRIEIREMESKSDKDAWKDAIDCFKETKDRLELKLSRLI
uniref:Uncharacterized protein n=1 Tax=Tanacetum cinerariifolium TaxID=118510 RepID=A0A6L2LSE0_TANCI|nr:hypothetical protein [Tanacetum cinerariifolium]